MSASRFLIHGVPFELRTRHAEARRSIRARFSRLLAEGGRHGSCHVIDVDPLIQQWHPPQLERVAEGAFLQEVARAHYPEYILVHAALIRAREGALLVAGASGAGKSTLAALARARGMSTPADDLVSVARDGTVEAWPIENRLRPVTRAFLEAQGISPDPQVAYATRETLPERIRSLHVLDDETRSTTAAVFAQTFSAWCGDLPAFLSELLRRLDGVSIHRHPRIRLDDARGALDALSLADAILGPTRLQRRAGR